RLRHAAARPSRADGPGEGEAGQGAQGPRRGEEPVQQGQRQALWPQGSQGQGREGEGPEGDAGAAEADARAEQGGPAGVREPRLGLALQAQAGGGERGPVGRQRENVKRAAAVRPNGVRGAAAALLSRGRSQLREPRIWDDRTERGCPSAPAATRLAT